MIVDIFPVQPAALCDDRGDFCLTVGSRLMILFRSIFSHLQAFAWCFANGLLLLLNLTMQMKMSTVEAKSIVSIFALTMRASLDAVFARFGYVIISTGVLSVCLIPTLT